MSDLLTDAGDQEMRAELAVLETLNDEIDQLSSQARDCATVAPAVAVALDIAWYFAEAALREAGHSSCGHVQAKSKLGAWCACCAHFTALQNKAEHIRRIL